jgi:glycosyltransferase involved in cell wall biosynthesis
MSPDKTRILYMIDELGPGGAERRLVQLLGRLDRNEFSAKLVLLTDIIHYEEIHDLGIEVITLDRTVRFDLSMYPRLVNICRDWRPDIIHAWGSLPAVYAGPVAWMTRTKFINAMIASSPEKLSAQQKLRAAFSFPFSDVIQANSHAGLKAFGAPAGKSNVIHNGFDFDRIKDLKNNDDVRKELGVGTRYIVGMVAGFHPLKDWDTLVEAAKIILEERADVTFVSVGGGTGLERIRELGGFSDRMIFPGQRSDVESIVNTFDVGVLSTFGEGISNSIIEYMVLGKPVVAAEGGGTLELVVNGETGFIIPQRSPAEMAEKIALLLDDERLRSTMGSKGRERIERDFSIDRMAAEHMDLYRKLSSGRRTC